LTLGGEQPAGAIRLPTAEQAALENHLGGEDAPRYRRYQFDLIAPHCGRSLLEVGAGLGEFSAQFSGLERLVLTDTDPLCLDALANRFAGRPEVTVAPIDLSAGVSIDSPVETVLAMNVLEHIPDDAGALRALAEVVLPGGSIVLWVPAYPSLYGDFDRLVGHVRRYRPADLRRAVLTAGLRVEVLQPVNLLGGLAWWAAVRTGRTSNANPKLVRAYDRVVIPLERALERVVRPPFGQSLLCVARVDGAA
jgi:SAM-dependent methyltransferase